MKEDRRNHSEFGTCDLSWACCQMETRQTGELQLWLWCRVSLAVSGEGTERAVPSTSTLAFTPLAFSPTTGIKSAISLLLPQRGGAALWSRPLNERIPRFEGCEATFSPRSCAALTLLPGTGSQQVLPDRARTGWRVQKLFGKHCWSRVQLPSRRGLSLSGYISITWKGHHLEQQETWHTPAPADCLPVESLFGPAW